MVINGMAKDPEPPAEACPVDPETRAAWLKSKSTTTFPIASVDAAKSSHGNSCDSSTVDQTPPPQPKGILSRLFGSSNPQPEPTAPNGLGVDRVVSTIPRASAVDETPNAKPANSEKESGSHASGNWIYPSEKMFFDSMARKGFQSQAEDMKTIVPLHNAINERAWKEIKEWEKPWGAEEKCGGPKLHSFLGLSTNMSPRARFNTLLGYTPPFDRHDWVVDRCGTRIEYVIDFYQGRSDGNGKLNMYLDVRPKLNTVEGWKMRAARFVGMT